MITFMKGNIFDSKTDVIAHQVNCQGIMGGGVAKQIKELYPIVFDAYKNLINEKGPDGVFGKCQLVQLKDVAIANLFGQKDFGTDKQHTDYAALKNSFIHLIKQMMNHNLKSVAFPDMIGCGLAGGDRETVLQMIREVFRFHKVEIWKL